MYSIFAAACGGYFHREKADAVAHWIKRNIVYNEWASAYPMDTFYLRTGNCMSYAQLIQAMMRLLGIPAVAGDGFIGEMQYMDIVELQAQDVGHAWFVYIDGEWALYDPLWGRYGVTDKDELASWYYMEMIEGVTPVYTEELPPFNREEAMVYQS